MENGDFERLLDDCRALVRQFPESLTFIGGIAVFLHAKSAALTAPLAACTEDADFYISLADMAELRDIEEMSTNRRQSKHQMVRSGFFFDAYTQGRSSLIVPYEAVVSASVKIGEVRVASLEHLVALKLEAYLNRRTSAKGDKDAKDLFRIAAAASSQDAPLNPALMAPYLREEHRPLWDEIYLSTVVSDLALGNSASAQQLRTQFRRQFGASSMDIKPSLSNKEHEGRRCGPRSAV